MSDVIGYCANEDLRTIPGRAYRESAGGVLPVGGHVTKASKLSVSGDVRVGRAVGGGRNPSAKRARGMGAVTALSTRANNGDWTARSMKRDAQDRRVVKRTIPGHVITPEAAARIAARKSLRAALTA